MGLRAWMESGGNPAPRLWGSRLRPLRCAELGKQVRVEKFQRAAVDFFARKKLPARKISPPFLSLPPLSLCCIALRVLPSVFLTLTWIAFPGVAPRSLYLCVCVCVVLRLCFFARGVGILVGWPGHIMLCNVSPTARRFEPLRAEPNGFLVHHLNHSVLLPDIANQAGRTQWTRNSNKPRDKPAHSRHTTRFKVHIV